MLSRQAQKTLQQASKRAAKPLQASVAGAVFKTGFYGSLALLAATTAALNNDQVEDVYLQYVPNGDKLMDGLDYAWKHKHEALDFDYAKFLDEQKNNTLASIDDLASTVGLGPFTDAKKVPKAPAAVVPKKEDQFIVLSEKPTTAKPVEAAAPSPAEVVAAASKPTALVSAATAAVKKSTEEAKKTLLPFVIIESNDSQVQKIVRDINAVISNLNASDAPAKAQKSIESIKSNLVQFAEKYQKVLSGKASDIEQLKKEELAKYEKLFAEQKVDLTKDMVSKLEDAKKTIEKKFSDKLQVELVETKKALALEAQNIILKSNVDATEEFINLVSKAVANERDSRLKDLDAVSARLDQVEQLEYQLSQSALKFAQFKQIQKTISSIQKLVSSNEPSSTKGSELVSKLSKLRELTSQFDDPLIKATLDSLPSDKELLTNGGVLTQSQLIERWNLLADNLRPVALLPENAGMLGYLASSVFSKFLLSKSGVSDKSNELMGNDIEAVIARVNTYLAKNQLDNAVEEVSLLKGESNKLASDWLLESRRKLELQVLTELLENEIKVSL